MIISTLCIPYRYSWKTKKIMRRFSKKIGTTYVQMVPIDMHHSLLLHMRGHVRLCVKCLWNLCNEMNEGMIGVTIRQEEELFLLIKWLLEKGYLCACVWCGNSKCKIWRKVTMTQAVKSSCLLNCQTFFELWFYNMVVNYARVVLWCAWYSIFLK